MIKHYNLGGGYPLCGVKRRAGATVNEHNKVTCEQCAASLRKSCSMREARQNHVARQNDKG